MEIINHKTGDKCHMKFEPYSYFGGIAKKVTGTVITADEKVDNQFLCFFKYKSVFKFKIAKFSLHFENQTNHHK